jgi:LysR family nitrogen assimilation transcriptional regulator
MDLKQIEYFVRVAELGSFTKASISLDIAQSALSRHVRLLETELRQNLLVRNGRGVTMTDAGKVLLEHGRGVLHQLENLKEELVREKKGLVGKIALGLPPSLTRVLSVPLLRSLRSSLPDAVISISEGLSLHMQDAVADGRLDIALLYDAQPSSDIDLKPVINQSLYLVEKRVPTSKTGPCDLKEVADYPLITPRRPNMLRMRIETELSTQGLHPNIAIEVDSISTILDLILEDYGYGILPTSTVLAFGHNEDFNLRPIVNPRILTTLSLATSAHRPLTQTQRNLSTLIIEKISELINPS